jgi:hypothetical protein
MREYGIRVRQWEDVPTESSVVEVSYSADCKLLDAAYGYFWADAVA